MVRLIAVLLAMLTDIIDGHLARKYHATSRVGTILDPAMDKFFVFFALIVFVLEGRLELWQAAAMLSRDFALCLFGLYLALTGYWQTYEFKAIQWGKISTSLQFIVLICLSLGLSIPEYAYTVFILFGVLSLSELLQFKPGSKSSTS